MLLSVSPSLESIPVATILVQCRCGPPHVARPSTCGNDEHLIEEQNEIGYTLAHGSIRADGLVHPDWSKRGVKAGERLHLIRPLAARCSVLIAHVSGFNLQLVQFKKFPHDGLLALLHLFVRPEEDHLGLVQKHDTVG